MPELWNQFFQDVPLNFYTIYYHQKFDSQFNLNETYKPLKVPTIKTD